jgi:hypothetical protein
MVENLNVKQINTDCSPSYLTDNISMTDKHIMYIHNSENQPRIIVIEKQYIKKFTIE